MIFLKDIKEIGDFSLFRVNYLITKNIWKWAFSPHLSKNFGDA